MAINFINHWHFLNLPVDWFYCSHCHIVCRPRGNVNTGQSYQHPHFFLRLLLSELFYAQGSHHFFFVETEVLIPLFSKSKKMSLKILCYGRRFVAANFVIVEVFKAKFFTWVYAKHKKGKNRSFKCTIWWLNLIRCSAVICFFCIYTSLFFLQRFCIMMKILTANKLSFSWFLLGFHIYFVSTSIK